MKIKSIKKVELSEAKQFYDVIDAAPYHNFLVKTTTGYIVSHNCNLTDEVNFGVSSNVEKQKEKQRKLIAQIDARMRSRFLRGTYLPTVNIIISSADTEQAFLQSYIEQKRQNESKTTLIVEEPQWVVDPRKGTPDDPGAFYVAVGNKFLAHELLPVNATEEEVNAYREKGYRMIKIPPGYHEVFLDNLDQALMDIVGLSSSSSTKYISGIRLNQIKTDEYKNPFTKDVIEVGNSHDDYSQYSNFFDMSLVNPKDMARPLFIHLDMSLSGDKTGIAGTWITGKRPGAVGEESTGRELEFKAAFSVSVKAPKGYQVSFEKTRNFIRWLRDRGFAIKCISMDTYQSANMAQSLTADGFKTQILSVDRVDTIGVENGRPARVCKPYAFFKSTIYERHLKLYRKCDLLTEEIANLERLSDGHIDHPKSGCFTGDTKVSLVDGRELTLLELVKEYESGKINYVYSFNEAKKIIEPKQIEKAWLTIKNAPLMEVELDNGEVLKCTPNHRFMLRDGSYIEAQDLLPGESLMPLYRKFPDDVVSMKNYRMYYEPIEDAWHYEHRKFATEVLDEKYLVHHKNCVRTDNSPTNLIWCSKQKHTEIHCKLQTGAQSTEANKKRKASLSAYYANPENKADLAKRNEKIANTLRARSAGSEYNLKKAERYKVYKEIEKTFNVVWADLSSSEKRSYCTRYSRATNPEVQKNITASVKERHAEGKYKNANIALNKSNAESRRLKELIPEVNKEKFAEIFGFDFDSLPPVKRPPYTVKYRRIVGKQILNHKIKAVRFTNEIADVYDLSIADNHNFALSAGVFVHNSKDQADALCGSLFTASEFAEEYAYDYGENLEAALDVNIEASDDFRKQQMIAEFQEELTKIYTEMAVANEVIDYKKKQEYEMYQNIMDGIIIL